MYVEGIEVHDATGRKCDVCYSLCMRAPLHTEPYTGWVQQIYAHVRRVTVCIMQNTFDKVSRYVCKTSSSIYTICYMELIYTYIYVYLFERICRALRARHVVMRLEYAHINILLFRFYQINLNAAARTSWCAS